MSEVIVVTSGKGGVGKTTTSANIGCGLALEGEKSSSRGFRHRTQKSGRRYGTGKQNSLRFGRRYRRHVQIKAGSYKG